jgi:uridylate kinase
MFNASENYIGKNGSSIELLGSVINGLAIRSAMFVQDTNNPRLMTGASIEALAEEYIPRKGIDHLSEGKVVLVTPGVNLPGLDITSVQCAAEFGFTTILKIDPDIPLEEVPKTLSFQQATELNLLNKTSAKMGEELNMSVLVFNDIYELRKVLSGDYSNGILIRG